MNLPSISRFRHLLTIQNGALALALLIALSWTWGTVSTLQRNFELQQQVDQLDQQMALAKLQNQNLAYQKNYYSSQEYLDISARQLLGKVAPGEHLVYLPDSSQIKDKTTPAATTTKVEKPSNFSEWMQFFFGGKQ